MRGNDSSLGCHVAVWRFTTITQSFCLYSHDFQLNPSKFGRKYISVLVRQTDEKESWLNEINIYFSTGFYDFPPALREKHGGIILLFRLNLLVSQGWLIFIFFLSMEKPFFSLLYLADKKSTQEKAPFHFPISRQWNKY